MERHMPRAMYDFVKAEQGEGDDHFNLTSKNWLSDISLLIYAYRRAKPLIQFLAHCSNNEDLGQQ